MEFSLTNLKTQTPHFSPMLTPNPVTTKHALSQWTPPKTLKNNANPIKMVARRTNCGKNTNLERELEEIEIQGRDWREMMNCKESKTTATLEELLECLEREAIMGDDEGREPTDYNRRALIFDKSSKVFQALKQLRGTTHQGNITTTES